MPEISAASPRPGLLVTADLIFSTKTTGTARALGLEMFVVGTPAAAVERLATTPAGCVILDLALPRLAPDAIAALVRAAAGTPVIAFGSHVDTASLDAARSAGCHDVMPRSRFAASLPQILQEHLGLKPQSRT